MSTGSEGSQLIELPTTASEEEVISYIQQLHKWVDIVSEYVTFPSGGYPGCMYPTCCSN